MEHVRWSSRPTLRTPVLIAAFTGWNDAGDAASAAVRHLIEAWRAEPVATLDPEEFYDFGTTRPLVHLAEGVTREIVWPPNDLWAASTPGADVLLLLGTEPQLKWRTFCRQITAIAARAGGDAGAHAGRAVRRRGPLAPGVAHRHGHRPGPHRPLPPGPVALRGTDGHRRAPSTTRAPVPVCRRRRCGRRCRPTPPGVNSPKAALALVERAAAIVGAPVSMRALEGAVADVRGRGDRAGGRPTTTWPATWAGSRRSTDDEDDDEEEEEDQPAPDATVEQFVEDVERFLRDQGRD